MQEPTICEIDVVEHQKECEREVMEQERIEEMVREGL